MDTNTLTSAGLATTFILITGIIYKIYVTVNHKRIRSNCCGTKMEASLDIEETTPPHQEVGFSKRSSPQLQPLEQPQTQIHVKKFSEIPPLDLQNNVVINPMRPKLTTP